METKTCSKCKEEKFLEFFGKDCSKKSGIRSYCKICARNFRKKYYLENREQELVRCTKYRKANPEKHAQHSRTYYQNHKKEVQKYKNEYDKQKMKLDPEYRLSRLLRDRLRKALKNDYKAGSAVRDLGCSIKFFKSYLELKFKENMTWNNQNEWHIDHIKPLSLFDLTNREEFLEACHYTNMQPLWAKDNLRKSNKYDDSGRNSN